MRKHEGAIIILLCFLILFNLLTSHAFFIGPNHERKHEEIPNENKEQERAEEEFSFDGCLNVFLDIGSNIGVHIRKLFEPEHYLHTKMRTLFNRGFGEEAEYRRQHTCALGIELNPVHTPHLQALARCYSSLGWRTHIITARAAANSDLDFSLLLSDSQHPLEKEWGARMGPLLPFDDSSSSTSSSTSSSSTSYSSTSSSSFLSASLSSSSSIIIRSMDLPRYIEEKICHRKLPERVEGGRGPPYVQAKVDIEGAEYQLYVGMLLHHNFCCINRVTHELHPHLLSEHPQPWLNIFEQVLHLARLRSGCPPLSSSYSSFFNSSSSSSSSFVLGPEFFLMDDESYLDDGIPPPPGCEGFTFV